MTIHKLQFMRVIYFFSLTDDIDKFIDKTRVFPLLPIIIFHSYELGSQEVRVGTKMSSLKEFQRRFQTSRI